MKSWNPEANDIFANAIEIKSPIERTDYIDRACKDDAALRERVEGMLGTHEQASGFLSHPAAGTDEGVDHLLAPTRFHVEVEPNAEGHKSIFDEFRARLPGLGRVVLRPQKEGSGPVVHRTSLELPASKSTGRYRLDGEIARGGMGAIIRGQDTDLGRDIAVKVLLESHQNVPEIVERFIEEAQIGGQLQHPGIAPIYELGQFEDGRPFFSMKLLKGETFAAVLSGRKSLAEDRARLLGVFEQICQTMSYAHSRGVIHRDLKPTNIMVGMFGEVQVMDWGLAKVLATGGVADERKSQRYQNEQKEIRTFRSGDSTDPGSVGSHTRLGSVLGTPAYMAPEQARGEIASLDERADVFGLGAILCEILTGSPPYVGESGNDVFHAASNGNLERCFARLAASEADADLQQLARDCLTIEIRDRPRDASVVTLRISDYIISVESRLRKAELSMAGETARANEAIKTSKAERERRHMTLALTGSVVLSLSLGGYALMWFEQREQYQVQANSEVVSKTLDNVYRLRSEAETADATHQIAKWTAVVAEARKAHALSANGIVQQAVFKRSQNVLADVEAASAKIQEELQRETERDSLLAKLDSIRQRQSESRDSTSFDLESTDRRYGETLADAGLDVLTKAPAQVALQIQDSPIREDLIIALDLWVRATPAHYDRREKIIRVADIADENQWRRELRAALQANDANALKSLAAMNETTAQPPRTLVPLGVALRDTGAVAASIDLLRKAQENAAKDFWVNLELGRSLSKSGANDEALGFARVAVAMQPTSAKALGDLALNLAAIGDVNQAAHVFQRLSVMVPDDFFVRISLARTWHSLGRFEDAIVECDEAIRINPGQNWGHLTKGLALEKLGRGDEAIAAYWGAVHAIPNDPRSYHELIQILKDRGEQAATANIRDRLLDIGLKWLDQDNVAQAIESFTQAAEADPQSSVAFYHLGMAMERSGNVVASIDALEKAVELDPQNSEPSMRLETARQMLHVTSDLDELLSGALEKSAAERLAAARLCLLKNLDIQCTRLCRQLVLETPQLVEPMAVACRVLGACAACRASSGKGDAATLAESERSRLRREALEWLQQVLTYQETQLLVEDPESSSSVVGILKPWRTTPDLSLIRDMVATERLPALEQQQLHTFWQRVDQCLNTARLRHLKYLLGVRPADESIASQLADLLLETHPTDWDQLKPRRMETDGEATLELLSDGSILASGKNIDGEVYRVTYGCSKEAITQLRLEALPHHSLPLGGPGRGYHARHETGNFVVKLNVYARHGDSDEPLSKLNFSQAWADQSNLHHPIDTDGNWDLGAWEDGKGQGQPHEAVFDLADTWTNKSHIPTEIVVEIKSRFDSTFHRNLGRFRLSVTDKEVHKSDQQTENGFVRLALAYQASGDDQSLQEWLQRAPKAAKVVGEWYAGGRWNEALDYYDRAVALGSRDWTLLCSRSDVLVRLGESEQAVADWNRFLEETSADSRPTEQRSQFLLRLLQTQPVMYERLRAMRADDELMRITPGRLSIVLGDWKRAAGIYAPLIESRPLGDEWFEYAALLVLLEEQAKYQHLMSKFAELARNSEDPFIAYCLARAGAIGADSGIDKEQLLSWANHAVSADRSPWNLHVLSLAQLRAKQYRDAVQTNHEASQSGWGTAHIQVDLVAALSSHFIGESTAGYRHSIDAREHMRTMAADLHGDATSAVSLDWLEANVLSRELERAFGSLDQAAIELELGRLTRDINDSPEDSGR